MQDFWYLKGETWQSELMSSLTVYHPEYTHMTINNVKHITSLSSTISISLNQSKISPTLQSLCAAMIDCMSSDWQGSPLGEHLHIETTKIQFRSALRFDLHCIQTLVSQCLNIVACEQGTVSEEPPLLRTATRHGPLTL